MSDPIDRQAAIDAIRNMCEECDSSYCGECRVSFPGREDCEKVLKGLPPAQPEPRWTPCDIAMPSEPFGCLVTVWDEEPMTGEMFENLLPYFVGWDGEQWNNGDGEQCPFEVIAWCRLPEPYRKETEDGTTN